MTDVAIDEFVKTHVSCLSCMYFTPDFFGGGKCDGPELPIGQMSISYSMCEQHELWDVRLQERLEALQDKWYDELVAQGLIPSEPALTARKGAHP